ncbi:MAG: flagellar transcriptional regulator FlhD [Nitrosomonas sp.]|nr:flagellar transcriptional regulator FlhD [Nitrosomonas sp.]
MLCRFRFDDLLVAEMLPSHCCDQAVSQLHSANLVAGNLLEQLDRSVRRRVVLCVIKVF